jgi:hypothetical protein
MCQGIMFKLEPPNNGAEPIRMTFSDLLLRIMTFLRAKIRPPSLKQHNAIGRRSEFVLPASDLPGQIRIIRAIALY